MKISANLGLLYADRALPDAIRAAGHDGFDAVECHFPYAANPAEVSAALHEAGLGMVGLNTSPGDTNRGDFGLAALPARVADGRKAIDQAIAYAAEIKARNVHVMAGVTDGSAKADEVFRRNLSYACDIAGPHGVGVLIEPINHRNVPGYHLSAVEHAADIIQDLGVKNLRLMFDCYHVQIMQGDLIRRLETYLPVIGHVQIAAVPDRGEPNAGEVNYCEILKALSAMGYAAPVGAEYVPRQGSSAGDLDWLAEFQAI